MLLTGIVAALALAASSTPTSADPEPETPAAHGFGMGAQTELISPNFGVAAALVAYDAGWSQWEGTVGVGIFERGANAVQNTNAYGVGLRAYFPVHRTARADFSLGGGGAGYLMDSGGGTSTVWTVLLGAKVRIFVVSNVAIVGSFGAAALFQPHGDAFMVGARPLGSAGFTYYFR